MASQAPTKPVPLEPSPLGTKEYWDKLYTTELSNHALDPSDVGTIWFDDSSAEDKILALLHSPELDLDLDTTSFLDLGTGNGNFLFRLREPWPPDADSGEDDDEKEDDEGGDVEGGKEGRSKMRRQNDGVDDNGDIDRHIKENHEKEEQQQKQKHRETGGFKGPMVGADYSLPSITFAKQLASSRGYDFTSVSPSSQLLITFIHHDILHSPTSALLSPLRSASTPSTATATTTKNTTTIAATTTTTTTTTTKNTTTTTATNTTTTTTTSTHKLGPSDHEQGLEQERGYDVILDKGTFDAISLFPFSTSSLNPPSPGDPAKRPRIEDAYATKILPLLKKGGLFLITSCNWTSEEIRCWFEGGGEGKEKRGFEYVDEVKYPSFSFGGRRGQAVCSVCFRRVG